MRIGTTIGLSLALLVVSAAAMAKEARSAQHHPAPSLKAKPAPHAAAARAGGKRHRASCEAAAGAHRRGGRPASRQAAALPPPDEYVGAVRVVGRREVGSAAWYGGRHIGQRTASGERLDDVHATAAHRSLPLDTLVRVTNLRNGRSVIAKINDRGPVSHSLLIDVSPRTAAALDMLHSGIAQVAIEPVAPAPTLAQAQAR